MGLTAIFCFCIAPLILSKHPASAEITYSTFLERISSIFWLTIAFDTSGSLMLKVPPKPQHSSSRSSSISSTFCNEVMRAFALSTTLEVRKAWQLLCQVTLVGAPLSSYRTLSILCRYSPKSYTREQNCFTFSIILSHHTCTRA